MKIFKWDEIQKHTAKMDVVQWMTTVSMMMYDHMVFKNIGIYFEANKEVGRLSTKLSK